MNLMECHFKLHTTSNIHMPPDSGTSSRYQESGLSPSLQIEAKTHLFRLRHFTLFCLFYNVFYLFCFVLFCLLFTVLFINCCTVSSSAQRGAFKWKCIIIIIIIIRRSDDVMIWWPLRCDCFVKYTHKERRGTVLCRFLHVKKIKKNKKNKNL